MEGAAEESDEDARVEDKPTVFWEKSIQQSIFLDLSEDESLHLSDLETSLALRLSRAESAGSEASVHLSGSAELSALDVTSSESSVVISSQSEMVVESKPESSILHVSAPKPNAVQDEPPLKHEDPLDTTDEEQEDLPYDLGSPYFNQTVNSEGNTSSDGRETIHASPDFSGVLECKTRDRDDVIDRLVSAERHAEKSATLSQEDGNNRFGGSKPSGVAPSCPRPSDLDQLLLRHFSQEELLRPRRLIEAETLPEVSLLESGEDTVCSWAPTHKSSTVNSKHSDGAESFCSDRTDETSASGKKCNLEDEAEGEIDAVTSSDSSRDTSAVDVEKQEKDEQLQRVPLVRTRSLSEMKYGQGQVHYPLPDFSKVAPKVKIPKSPTNGPARPVPQSPSSMHRAQSSPEMLGLIHRVLEDSVQPAVKPYVFKEEDKQSAPALVYHLQIEYDKLLTKYAEAENRIDQMRTGTNAQPSSDLMDLYLEHDDDLQGNLVEGSHLGSVASHLPPSENLQSSKVMNTASSNPPEEEDGERMTAELMDIISQFMQKVEEFKSSVSIMSTSTAEQQTMLRSMMEAQDQLEREYIRRKEQHRALEMQNYLGLSRKTGVFDPNRQVEGDLFRIGMQLEDIKEMIDKNVCEQISPPHSSSTPTPPMKEVELSPLYMPSPSPPPPPSLHEGGFSTAGYEMETQKEEVEEESEGHGGDGFLNTGHNFCYASSSVAGQETQTLEAEDERSSVCSEATDHSNILAYVSGSSASSRRREWTCNSTPDSVLSPVGGCDLGDCVSLAVEVLFRDSDSHVLSEPRLNASSPSQRFVSPETDSGFGSSYLNQSASGPIQLNLLIESGPSQSDGLSGSDSEGSSSNLQTAVRSASLSSQRWVRPNASVQTQSGGAAVERWVESTTKEPPARLQGSDRSRPAQLHHHVSEPELGTTMDTEERGNPLHSCSCHSETIVALQSEVSRLKKDLEQGLVQLPHLAQKMDDLTSKYKQDHQERKTRPRTHRRPACNSVWMPSSSTQNVSNPSSRQMRRDDWISSDPSRSRDSDATAGSEVMLQFHNSPVEGRRDSVHSAPEFQHRLHEASQSIRGSKRNGSVETSRLTGHVLKEGKTSDSHEKQRPQTAIMESFYSKESWSLFPSASLQKPLLQVGYGSSSSLPASYKVRETPLRSVSHHRKRSTQSDSALLPSNVFFQRTPSPASRPSKTGSRSGRCRGTKEVEMNRTLDQAIEVARCMKRTTDRMAKRLSADLAEARLHRSVRSVQPAGGRRPRYNQQSTDQFPL